MNEPRTIESMLLAQDRPTVRIVAPSLAAASEAAEIHAEERALRAVRGQAPLTAHDCRVAREEYVAAVEWDEGPAYGVECVREWEAQS
jgi:hypothetical protein